MPGKGKSPLTFRKISLFKEMEAALLSGQSWGFEYGRPGLLTTEWICPR